MSIYKYTNTYMYTHQGKSSPLSRAGAHTLYLCTASQACLCSSTPPQPYSKPELLEASPGRSSCPTGRSTEKTTACRLSIRPGSTPGLLTLFLLGVWRVMGAGKFQDRITESFKVLHFCTKLKPQVLPSGFFSLPGPRYIIWMFISKLSSKEQDCTM